MPFLSISTLGSFQVTLDGVEVEGFEYNKVKGLLAYLAVESNRAHHRELLAEILWPDRPAQMARNSLRQALSILRNAIQDRDAQVPFLLINRDSVQFNRRSDYWLDVDVFIDSLQACRSSLRKGVDSNTRSCIHWLKQSARLFRGEFLDQFLLQDSNQYSDWIKIKREEYRRQAIEIFALLSSYHERQGDHDDARQYARRMLDLDPTHEDAHRKLMRIYYRLGDRSSAIAQYELCRRLLAEQLGVKPEEETVTLFDRIRSLEEVRPEGMAHPVDVLSRPHFIPREDTPLLGREKEVFSIMEILDDPATHLLTIVGPGGVGKTRIAQRVARDRLEKYADGVFFVALAALPGAEYIPVAIADAMNLDFSGERDRTERLMNSLRDRELLLVLDNMEHLTGGSDLVNELLVLAPKLQVVVTSREMLGIAGEKLFEPKGLRYPDNDDGSDFDSFSSVQLFVRSARRLDQEFSLTAMNREPVGRICRLLEGVPLGIELAASWVRVLSVSEIAGEIEEDLSFLESNRTDLPQRHRSLRSVFQNSWNILSEEERKGFSALSVFHGGFYRDAAESVAGVSLGALASFVSRSLVRRSMETRYEVHEILRQFAYERLEGELREKTEHLHMDYFAGLLGENESALRGIDQKRILEEIDIEMGNIRRAWIGACSRGNLSVMERMLDPLTRYYEIRSRFQEGEEAMHMAITALSVDVIEARNPQKKRLMGNLHGAVAWYMMRRGDLNGALTHLQRAMEMLLPAGENRSLALLYCSFGIHCQMTGDLDKSRSYLEKSLSYHIQTENSWGMAEALRNLGITNIALGEPATAREVLEESLELYRLEGDVRGVAQALDGLGRIMRDGGELDESTSLFRESSEIKTELGDRWGSAVSFRELGDNANSKGDLKGARSLYLKSLSLFHETGDLLGAVSLYNRMGEVDGSSGERTSARVNYVAALEQSQQAGIITGILESLLGLARLDMENEAKRTQVINLLQLLEGHDRSSPFVKKEATLLLEELVGEDALSNGKEGDSERMKTLLSMDEAVGYYLQRERQVD